MPSLERLDRFKNVVNSLGNEPAILEERGEHLEDVPRPEEGLPDDLSALLDDTEGVETEDEMEDFFQDLMEEEPAGALDDLDLDELGDLETGEEAEPAEPEGPAAAEEPAAPETPPEEAAPEYEAPEAPLEEAVPEDEEAQPEEPAPETPEEPETAEEAEGPEEEELDLDALIEETSPEGMAGEEVPGAEEGTAPEEAEMEFGAEDLDLDIDADLGELEEGGEAEEGGEEIEAAGEEFELPDEFAAPEEEAPEAEAAEAEAPEPEGPEAETPEPEAEVPETETPEPEEEAPEEEVPEEEAPEEEAPAAEEGFGDELGDELGDLDEFDLDELDMEGGEMPEAEAPAEEGFEAPEAEMPEEGLEAPEAEMPEEEFEAPEEEEAFEAGPEEEEAPGEEAIEFEDEFGFDIDTELGEEKGEFPFDEEEGMEVETEEGGAPEIEMGPSDFEGVPSADEFELPEGEEEIGEEDFEVDQFDLGDISKEFDLGEAPGFEEAEIAPPEAPGEELEGAEETFEISDADYVNIKRTLGSLPRNLKMAIEELIAEKDLAGDDLKKIIDMLSSGKSAKAIAAAVSRITGKKIEIPEQYEKRTGAEFEEEIQTFGYIFRTKVFPYVKVALAAMVILGFLGFIGYRFIYRPLYAGSLYRKGYEELQEDEYLPAKEHFDEAYEIWPKKKWFYTYAEGYIDKKQYALAEEMYDRLITEEPEEIQGYLDYAHLESNILSNYRKAESLLERVLDLDRFNYDALLASGDNYLSWSRQDETKLEPARQAYARALKQYGPKTEVLFRMLRFFIMTDNFREVERLKDQFQASPKITVDPHIYAELGGYLISKNEIEDVENVLFRAMNVDRTVPEIHYHLARYYEEIEDYGEMDIALKNGLSYFQQTDPLTTERLSKLIDTHKRIGESHYRKEEYIQSEQSFQRGIKLYEDAKERDLLGPKAMYGELYADLGDVYYYVGGNKETAYNLYEEAELNLFTSQELSYKKGFILYERGDYQDSLLEFYKAAGDFSKNKNLMYSTANTLYNEGKYFAAQGYYNHLLDVIEQEEASIPFLMIDERDDHRGLVEYFKRVYNNLGVTLNRLAQNSPDSSKYSRSLAYLTRSTEYADILNRNPETLEQPISKSLAYRNIRAIVYPAGGEELQIYQDLPLDMEDLLF
jgi:tetratricopeptide (TPR) repeat protein